MHLYLLEPEVAGGLGEKTTYYNKTYKNGLKLISFLNYEFEGWLGDELLESTPSFIVTQELANSIQYSQLNGYVFEGVEITKSDLFQEIYPNRILPNFKRLIPNGKVSINNDTYNNWSQEDFCLSENLELVVSPQALKVLNLHVLKHCNVIKLERNISTGAFLN
ncbi:hypothetical protein [Fictibacillus phosphorivorans]|uniref:hypothetical protein n=1 Tax=Fictibacillus phosphorivorans TaxID=1221500 RepID=UPI0011A75409|nr:hypothetical protein [Fictibacillus phosphorivorans]